MVRKLGTFAGKTAFGSAPGAGEPCYLTIKTLRYNNTPLRIPAMSAPAITDLERCILYRQPGGAIRIQMGDGSWLGFQSGPGWIVLADDFSVAAGFRAGGNPPGQTMEVCIDTRKATFARVFYTVGGVTPILTINAADGVQDTFAPAILTPPLELIQQGGLPGGDLNHVDLSDANLTGVDLTGASLSKATLIGTVCKGTKLGGAVFDGATLLEVSCDGATLDGASFEGAHLDNLAWGSPASAPGIKLTACHARGAILGKQAPSLDCTGASLAAGDFQGAYLNGLNLTNAKAGGARLVDCHLDGATLDGADLRGVVAVRASFQGASLQGADGRGSSFVCAVLSGADLTRARFGARSYLFALPGSFIAELDRYAYAQLDLVTLFQKNGENLSDQARINVVTWGSQWGLIQKGASYDLRLNDKGTVDVYGLTSPATFYGAICQGTRAPSAALSGADLRNVAWYAAPATLDHADLEDATLSGSLLAEADFTQATLSGVDLSRCVLAQARFHQCRFGAGPGGRAASLDGAHLGGAEFDGANLLGATLANAAVALARGVPLFRLDASEAKYLTTQGLATLAPKFAQAGYPIGHSATIAQRSSWTLDNSADPNQGDPRHYRIQQQADSAQLLVFDGDSGSELFDLPQADEALLKASTAAPPLVAAFANNGYTLASGAPLSSESHWEIRIGDDAPIVGPFAYPKLRVYADPAYLSVYGSVLMQLRDWGQYPDGLAFRATTRLEEAVDSSSFGPSGCPRAWVDAGWIDWEVWVTAASCGTTVQAESIVHQANH